MNLRRGFKSEANWYSADIRRAMGLLPYDPINVIELATLLEVPLLKLSEFAESHPTEVARLRGHDIKSDFSAATFFNGNHRSVIFNDRHGPKRQASDLAHELSHCLLLHPPSPMLDDNHARTFNAEHEDEANWLGPALLVSEEAALRIVRAGMSIGQASSIYGATEDVVRMRLNVTGAVLRAKPNSEAAE